MHPSDGSFTQVHGGQSMLGALLYLLCDDLIETMAELSKKGVACTPVDEADWGASTSFPLPSGGSIGLYQPKHELAIS